MFAYRSVRVALLGLSLTAALASSHVYAADDSTTKSADAASTTPPAGRPRMDPTERLKNYRDQFEGLNLSDDQMTKIDGFITTAETEVKRLLGADADDSARREAFAAIRKLDEDVQSVLTDPQKAQLRQKRQQMMVDRFKTEYTKASLNLTDDQLKKVNAIFDDMKSQMAALPKGDDRESRGKAFQLLRDTRDKLNTVLTPEQQKQIPQFGRRGRGGNNGGNGGGTPPAPPAQ